MFQRIFNLNIIYSLQMPQLSADDKGKLIDMHASGMSNGHIAQVLGISKPTVARWIKRNDEHENCTRQHGSGRKRKTDARFDRAVCQMVLAHRFACATDILKVIPHEFVSKYTFYRRIREGTDFDNYWVAKKPFINERNRQRRVAWCELMRISPGLNPIENLWSILDHNVRDRRPQSKAELFRVLQDGWNALDRDLLRRLVDSMPRRIQAVLDNNGWPTKY